MAAYGELAPGLQLAELRGRIARHFGVERTGPSQIDDSAADIPLVDAAEESAQDKVNLP